MSDQQIDIGGLLEEFRRLVQWEEKTPPNTILRSAYLNGVATVAMLEIAKILPNTRLHTLECRSPGGAFIVSEWIVFHDAKVFSIEGLTTLDLTKNALLERAKSRDPNGAMGARITELIKDPFDPVLQDKVALNESYKEVARANFNQAWAQAIAIKLDACAPVVMESSAKLRRM